MDHAFILPLPESNFRSSTESPSLTNSSGSKIKTLQNALERIKNHKMSLDLFFDLFDPDDPTLKNAQTKDGNNILHLAVIQDAQVLPGNISEDRSLLFQRNHFGLTPIDLASYLQRGSFCSYLKKMSQARIVKEKYWQSLHENLPGKQISYLSNPIFPNVKDLYLILNALKKAKTNDRIPPENTWMGIYFDKEIGSSWHPEINIKHVDEEVGLGVFSCQRIAPCSFVGEYTGEIVEKKNQKNLKYFVRYPLDLLQKKNYIISAESKGNFTRYINHSNNPNLSLQTVYWRGMPRMIFLSLREISEGEQLTFDYGTFFWKQSLQTPKQF